MQRHFSSLRLKAVPRMAEVEREVVPQSLPEAARAFLLGLGVCFAAWQWDGNVAHMPGSDAGGEQAPQRSRPGNDVTALGTRSFFTPPWLSGTRCALEDGQQEPVQTAQRFSARLARYPERSGTTPLLGRDSGAEEGLSRGNAPAARQMQSFMTPFTAHCATVSTVGSAPRTVGGVRARSWRQQNRPPLRRTSFAPRSLRKPVSRHSLALRSLCL